MSRAADPSAFTAAEAPAEGEIWAVAPAGGSGTRFSEAEDKLLVELAGLPVLVRTVQALCALPELAGIVIAAPPERQAVYRGLLERHANGKPVRFAPGGRGRRESVYNGLLVLPESAGIVAVHDAARPLIAPETIARALASVRQGAAGAVVALPVHDTVKQARWAGPDVPTANVPAQSGPARDGLAVPAPGGKEVHPAAVIDCTVDRAMLWRAQTPQIFRSDLILAAHRAVPAETPVTDDAQLMELAGFGPVELIEGDACNLKITTRADLALAEAYLAQFQ